jgi:hypothetical protein
MVATVMIVPTMQPLHCVNVEAVIRFDISVPNSRGIGYPLQRSHIESSVSLAKSLVAK